MANYPMSRKKDSNYCTSQTSSYSDAYAKDHCSLYLKDEIYADQFRNVKHYYRLNAMDAHRERDYLKYDIECPHCHCILRVVDGPVSSHVLGLYECPNCDHNEERRFR